MNDPKASWRSTFSQRSCGFNLWPFFLVLGLCACAFKFGEQYPITRFPMYDKFPDHTFYVYVADKNGIPIPVQDLTGVNTSKLKKPYDYELDRNDTHKLLLKVLVEQQGKTLPDFSKKFLERAAELRLAAEGAAATCVR